MNDRVVEVNNFFPRDIDQTILSLFRSINVSNEIFRQQ